MVTTETLEGTIDATVSYHFDVADDVLYLRLVSCRDTATLGEETDDGLIELRDEATGSLVGITVVSWWKRFGHGSLPDSLRAIESRIEPWAAKIAA
jgi:hypothetical protein